MLLLLNESREDFGLDHFLKSSDVLFDGMKFMQKRDPYYCELFFAVHDWFLGFEVGKKVSDRISFFLLFFGLHTRHTM